MENLFKALIKAQEEMSNPIKGSNNPFFRSKYADLNAVREACVPILNKHGIAVLQPMVTENGVNYVRTVLIHESGESFHSDTEIIYAKANDAQAQGSGITYARRYGLQSLVMLGADDDDGNGASSQPSKKEPKQIGKELDEILKKFDSCKTHDEAKKLFYDNNSKFGKNKLFVDKANKVSEKFKTNK